MTKKVFIRGYYGAGNAGDEAILEGMLRDLRERMPVLRAVVASSDPASTSRSYNVESISNGDKAATLTAVRDCDIIILGGGGVLNDYWDVSLASLFSQTGTPLNYFVCAALAALYAKPLVLYAVGVGPLSTKIGQLYTKMMAEVAKVISVRDEQSKKILGELGIDTARIHVTADPAFLLTYALPTLDLPRPILGVALRNWSIGINSETWEWEVAAALDELLSRHGGSVLFLPFQRSTSENDNDRAVAERVRSRMSRHQSATIFEAAGAAHELAGAIGQCDSMLGMRYHSVLFALRNGVKTVGLVYDPKVRSLLASAGCEDYALDLGAVRADNLLNRLETAFGDTNLSTKLTSFSNRMSAAAAENGRQVTDLLLDPVSHPARASMQRWWLDELSAEAAFKENGAIMRSVAERRNGLKLESGQNWPYDIVCFPGIEWDYRWMRPQQLMSQFAERGHRVFFVSVAEFLPQAGPKFVVRALRQNVWEVKLASREAVSVNSGCMPDDLRDSLVDDLAALAREFAIDRAACVLHLSTWGTTAYKLRSLFGWRVVYDCMDDWSGFAWMSAAMLGNELLLVSNSDLVVVTAQKLWDQWSPRNRNTVLVRNAVDPEHYQRRSAADLPVEMPSSGPVVGFFGAIDSWFDVELVIQAATARPQYFFALIGDVYDERAESLRHLPNVRLFGNRQYDILPAYLRRFDACIIPFKVNALTRSTDPVKFYEYIAQGKPVVSTRIPELEPYREIAYLAEGAEDFIRLLDVAVTERNPDLRERRKALAGENSWAARAELFDDAMERTFDATRTGPRILFAYQTLGLGGVEIVLRSRVEELHHRGCSICLVFMEEIDGRSLFEGSGIDVRVCPQESDLAEVMAGFKPDWIVSIDTPVILAIAQRTTPEAALVYEVHSPYPHMLVPLADRSFLTGVRGVIVPSPSHRDRIRPLMALDKPIEIVSNALSPAFIHPDDRFEASPQPIVLWVGRLDSLKGWRRFIEIANQLRSRTDAEFWLISGGPSGEGGVELPGLIESLGLSGRLRWIPSVEHSHMPGVYRASAQSGGCLVSTSSNESFGMAVLEAMACGCPVVVPDVVGLRDLVRHTENGRVYPAGELEAACGEIIETLNQPPELRRIVIERAAEFALSFSLERTADRFLAVLTDWSTPRASQAETQSTPVPNREFLSGIIETAPEETRIVIFPPSLPWTAATLSSRAQRWARAFARCGCLVFYSDPQRVGDGGAEFTEVESRIFTANVPLDVYRCVKSPIVVADSSNVDQLCHFCDPLVLYECREGASENESSLADLRAEWLARANVVTLTSDKFRDSIARRRPDAILASDEQLLRDDFVLTILSRLQSGSPGEDDLYRLRALLDWRERQVSALKREIQDRDRPAVEILRDAIAEQKQVLADRDRGIAFLRKEVAARDKIVAERNQAVEFLENATIHRDAVLAFLRNEIESRDQIILERQNAIEFLQREVAAQRESLTFLRDEVAQRESVISERQNEIAFRQDELAAQSKSTAFFRDEVKQRDSVISERQNTIESLQQDVAAQQKGLTFLREEIAQRDSVILERQNAIEFLQQDLAARDIAAAAQLEGIAFLRGELAQREVVIAERRDIEVRRSVDDDYGDRKGGAEITGLS